VTETATMVSTAAIVSNTKFVIKSQTKPVGSEYMLIKNYDTKRF
jgi:hypothetical protein